MIKNLVNITDAAADHVNALVARAEKPVLGVRLSVSTKGCSGMSYDMEYATEAKPGDEIVEHNGARVFVDPMATMFVLGTEIDYTDDTFHSGFTFTNPNEKGRCGCGESFHI